MEMTQVLIPLSLALLVWGVAQNVKVGKGKAAKALTDFYAERTQTHKSKGEEIGEAVAGKLLSVKTWEDHLRWAQRGGQYLGQSLGGVVFQSLLFAGLASLVILINPAPVAFLLPFGAFAYPLARLRSKANTVRKRVFRTLPETAALIAAELAAGTAPDVAVARAAAIPGPLSTLLREAVEMSRGTGRPLFSRKPITGALVEVMGASGIPALHAFGSQLDLVASKGVAGAALMAEIARALGQEYRAKLQSEVEKLDSRLVLVVALFFFVPFVALLLFAALSPILTVFAE
jgi:Flp pilus assembly protein TadB